ncbi:hypothetical protein BDV12DRAFT_180658, partial [Aspergillus spectabilis]
MDKGKFRDYLAQSLPMLSGWLGYGTPGEIPYGVSPRDEPAPKEDIDRAVQWLVELV